MSNISFPGDFEVRMRQQLGDQWSDFAKAHAEPSPVSIRLNPGKDSAFKSFPSVPWSNYGKYLHERPSFTLDPHFHGGAYYVQEASSMFLEQAVKQTADLSQKLTVLDLSAAPGGKSTHLLSLISNESLLVSNEVIRSRAAILAENIQKWGYPNCLVTNSDPKDFHSLNGYFDLIVVDAPCSGEGMFRKDPEAMTEWSVDNVALCAGRQQRILHDVWPALKENGILIYCTCTYNEDENERNLLWLKKEHDIEFIELETDPKWGIEKISRGGICGYRCMPHRLLGEGFFLSVIRKKESESTGRIKVKNKLVAANKKATDSLSKWVVNAEQYKFLQHQDLIYLVPADHTTQIENLLTHLRFVYTGCNVATVKQEKLIPEHALAISTIINREAFFNLEVDLNLALQYLRRETPALASDQRGYALIAFENTAIGWVNMLPNRMNNMYPQEWRIRMSR